MEIRRTAIALGALASLALGAAALPAAAPAASRPQVRILGFTTQVPLGVPKAEAKPGTTFTACAQPRGGGMRDLYVIYEGRGIAKGTKVGAALWGPPRNPAGREAEPTIAEIMRESYRWPVKAEQTKRQVYGYGFAQGPFGPVSIDGRWTASVVVAGRTVARKSVTIACR